MAVVLFAFWWLLNGTMTAELALIGIALCGLLRLFAWKCLGLTLKRERAVIRRVPALLGYVVFLVGEILKAAAKTLRLIWSPTLVCEPRLTSFRTRLRTKQGRAVMADSITLTPGTITIDVKGDAFLVHCLDRDFAEGLGGGEMETRVLRVEKGGADRA